MSILSKINRVEAIVSDLDRKLHAIESYGPEVNPRVTILMDKADLHALRFVLSRVERDSRPFISTGRGRFGV